MAAAQRIVVGTRGSALALAQTEMVVAALRTAHRGVEFDVKIIRTGGDRDQNTPLSEIGGEGMFVKEIEHALQSNDVDLAVHSLKDMPAAQPDDLTLAAILPREDPRDVLVSRHALSLRELPDGARVGTGSLRRQAQIRAFRPDLEVVGLRGNVDTRLRKAGTEGYDAIVLALAGLKRLGLADQVTEVLPLDVMLPAVGQGAIAIEARAVDVRTIELALRLEDSATRAAVEAERSFLQELGGGCHVPIAAHAQATAQSLWLRGLVADPEGKQVLRGAVHGARESAAQLGRELGRQLIDRGASALLAAR